MILRSTDVHLCGIWSDHDRRRSDISLLLRMDQKIYCPAWPLVGIGSNTHFPLEGLALTESEVHQGLHWRPWSWAGPLTTPCLCFLHCKAESHIYLGIAGLIEIRLCGRWDRWIVPPEKPCVHSRCLLFITSCYYQGCAEGDFEKHSSIMATCRTGCCGIGSRTQKSPREKTEPKATHAAHESTTVEGSHVFWASLGSQQGSVPFGKQLHESRSNTCLPTLPKGMTTLIKFTHFFFNNGRFHTHVRAKPTYWFSGLALNNHHYCSNGYTELTNVEKGSSSCLWHETMLAVFWVAKAEVGKCFRTGPDKDYFWLRGPYGPCHYNPALPLYHI